jgi:hypothetical protein
MSKKKVKVLKAVTPPGFQYTALETINGIPVKVIKYNICKPGDVIEIDATLADGYEKSGIAVPASSLDKVTKVAENGEFRNAESRTEKQNSVSPEANDKH